MKSFSVDRRVSPSIRAFGPAVALMLAVGCSSGGGDGAGGGALGGGGGGSTGASNHGGAGAGNTSSSVVLSSGDNPGSGGTTAKGGSSGGVTGVAGSRSSGGSPGGTISSSSGGTTGSGGTTAKGGTTNVGGTTAKGGTTSTGTTSSSGGAPAKDAGAGVDGAKSTGSPTDGGGSCPTAMPEGGGVTKTGKNVNGTANGLGYGIWTDGNGGSITVYDNAHAFSASWDESKDFLAHLGLDFRPGKDWTTLGTIAAEYSEVKSGSGGPWSMIGIYGWTQSPCVEWYINEDSWRGMSGGSGTSVDIDGGTYYIRTLETNGTGGANACESGHTGMWTQMISNRKSARTCGTVTVSEHFAAWEKQGWKLGALTSVHINVEVGGGTGKIDFPLANVTTTNK